MCSVRCTCSRYISDHGPRVRQATNTRHSVRLCAVCQTGTSHSTSDLWLSLFVVPPTYQSKGLPSLARTNMFAGKQVVMSSRVKRHRIERCGSSVLPAQFPALPPSLGILGVLNSGAATPEAARQQAQPRFNIFLGPCCTPPSSCYTKNTPISGIAYPTMQARSCGPFCAW